MLEITLLPYRDNQHDTQIGMFIPTHKGVRNHPESQGMSIYRALYNTLKGVKIHPMHGAAEYLMLSDKVIRVLIIALLFNSVGL